MDKEQFGGGRVKGSMVSAHVDWVREHRNPEEVEAFLHSLPPAMRSILPSTWYPFEDVVALDRAIMERFGKGELRFLEELGEWSARQNLKGVYRTFKRADVHEFFRRTALLHTQFMDFGTSRYEDVAPTAGRIVHAGYKSYSPIYCASAVGFYRECIRLHGGTNVLVREAQCHCRGDQSCTYEMTWS